MKMRKGKSVKKDGKQFPVLNKQKIKNFDKIPSKNEKIYIRERRNMKMRKKNFSTKFQIEKEESGVLRNEQM